jgi:hypothetical protein
MALSYQIVVGCSAIFLLFWIGSAFFVKPSLKREASSTAILVRLALLIGLSLILTRCRHALHLSALPPTPLRGAGGDIV